MLRSGCQWTTAELKRQTNDQPTNLDDVIMDIEKLHESQETDASAQYKWLVPVAALFHLQMNLVHLLFLTPFGSEKPAARLDHSHLRHNVEFWNCTKIRPGKFDLHAAEELIIHSYKARELQ